MRAEPQDYDANLFEFVVCWFFLMTGKCEPMMVSQPVTLEICERAQLKVRARRSKNIIAYCL